MDTKSKMTQLLLFEDPKSEYQALWEAFEKMKMSNDKTRKRLFAEISDLQKNLISLKAENERMKFFVEMKPALSWTNAI